MEFLLGITSVTTIVLAIMVYNYRKKAISYDAERIELEKNLAELQKDIAVEITKAEILPTQFENLANKLLETTSEKFSKQSKEALANILNPFNDKITELQKRVVEERSILQKQVENISLEAHNLTRALKSDSKAQGNWGEFTLKKLLESSGLQEGTHYTAQAKGLNLKNADGDKIIPDFIINLPDNKHIIIDSKVSLTYYERYINESDDEKKEHHIKQFISSVKTHIKELSGKNYHTTKELGTPDFTLMYMPIEGAHSLISQSESNLYNFAWDKGIAMASPLTLFATLKTISSIWKMDSQNKNAQEIARQSGALYEKFANFAEDMQEIKRGIDKSDSAYNSAINKLTEGRGNLINRVENIKKLGAKTNKSIPQELLNHKNLKVVNMDIKEDK